jgi:hypothetical protein
MSNLQRVGPGKEFLNEGVMDRAMHEEARSGGAFLPRAAKGAVDGEIHRAIEIAIIHHDERVLRAHFKLQLHEARRGKGGDLRAYFDRAGEADALYVGLPDELATDCAARAHDEIEQTLRHRLSADDFRQTPGAGGRQIGGLPYDGVAERERGRDLPGGGRHREIPGRNHRDRSERLARDQHFHAGPNRVRAQAQIAHSLAREIREELARAIDFANALRQRLALLAGEKRAQFLRPRHQFATDGVE